MMTDIYWCWHSVGEIGLQTAFLDTAEGRWQDSGPPFELAQRMQLPVACVGVYSPRRKSVLSQLAR